MKSPDDGDEGVSPFHCCGEPEGDPADNRRDAEASRRYNFHCY